MCHMLGHERNVSVLYYLHITHTHSEPVNSLTMVCVEVSSHQHLPHLSKHRKEEKEKNLIRASVDGRMRGDRQQTQTQRESRMERANRKGQVLKDKQIVKDKAMRAGSVLFNLSGIPADHI